ncbi:hypothetical protein [Eubacterium oxidoreducens]|uniref:Uncharacterized protein n=1 Tax=Eubacterium oxidoreducens TaxID=1732 RepID=A0A1G6A080_EUBOX|nr:hypothetical protein [Eubacterium oxidoreducens]SDB01795.1 hypothetical protein SAMN02910417_00079 [Eubacterium oxidoreducens]
MRSKKLKMLIRSASAASLAVITAIMLAAPGSSSVVATAAVEDAGEVVTAIDLTAETVTTADSDVETYTASMTFVQVDNGTYTELSLKDAQSAVESGKTVKMYTKSHSEGYGSVWSDSYDYTTYRTGIQIGQDSDVALGTDGVGGTLDGTTLSNFYLSSTSKNFNPIVVNQSNATLDNPVIVAGNADGEDNSDGNADINDFVGYGTAVNIYGGTTTTDGSANADGQTGGTTVTSNTFKTMLDLSNGGSITTYGVARPAVAVDNGGDVVIKGDGNDSTQEIAVYGGETYDGFLNTADTVKMVSPPWVLGIVGNSRATNMLGKGSTMVVQDANVYAKNWGVLSTDSGSEPYLYAINSDIVMNTSSANGAVSGYGSYAIGNAHEYFLGSTFDVATYLTIAANGNNNTITLGATTKNETINTAKTIWDAEGNTSVDEDYNTVTASKTAQTVVNSKNFGIDIWGQATVDVNDKTTFNTKSAAFLVKSADATINIGEDATINAATDANAEAETELNNTENGVIFQAIDNEDAVAEGISFPNGYSGPVFSDASYNESEGWLSGEGMEASHTATLNIADKNLEGNIYNGTGYLASAVTVNVNIEESASVTGAISATTIKHTTDGGKTQNTTITESDYNQIGHVINTASSNGENDVNLTVDGTWVADGTSILASLTIGEDATVVYGTATDANGNVITLEKGKTYKDITITEGTNKAVSAASVSLKDKTAVYTGKAISIDTATVNDDNTGKVTYTYYTDKACTKLTTKANSGAASDGAAPVNAGTYYVKATVAATDSYKEATSTAAKLTITKATQKVTVKNASKTYKVSALKKNAKSFKVTTKTTASNASVKYTAANSKSKKVLTIKQNGKITVKKGTKAGTYKVKVKVTAKNYKAATKTITVKVKK